MWAVEVVETKTSAMLRELKNGIPNKLKDYRIGERNASYTLGIARQEHAVGTYIIMGY